MSKPQSAPTSKIPPVAAALLSEANWREKLLELARSLRADREANVRMLLEQLPEDEALLILQELDDTGYRSMAHGCDIRLGVSFILLGRDIEANDLITVEALAVELDPLMGEAVDDRRPRTVDCWRTTT